MSCLNLQRNSEIFVSTVDLASGGDPASMVPNNTWKVEVLAGFAATAGADTQDITSMESGTNPDRSQQRFNTAINPVDWNFQTYIRPTGAEADADGPVKPLADWFLWQAMVSNTAPASGTNPQTVWSDGGILYTTNVAASGNSHSSYTNFATAQENHVYLKLDNVFYQVTDATVNQVAVDAGIEEIATTTWTGFGKDLIELTGTNRNNAVSVFGGIDNSGTSVSANAESANLVASYSYHPFDVMAGATNSFIKNRLSTIEFNHAASEGATANTYVFPVTALTFEYNNNITYLTPEELANLNTPIGQFTGTRAVTGSATMYLRSGTDESAQFLRNIYDDSRTNSSHTSNALIRVGGATAPYVNLQMDAVQFEFPQLAIEDVIAVSVNFVAQEATDDCGTGGEVTITAAK